MLPLPYWHSASLKLPATSDAILPSGLAPYVWNWTCFGFLKEVAGLQLEQENGYYTPDFSDSSQGDALVTSPGTTFLVEHRKKPFLITPSPPLVERRLLAPHRR